jgi:ribonuclease P protein component
MIPSKNRLKKERDFQQVIRNGKYLSSDLISIKFFSNSIGTTRIGFIVSKKISKKAVLRNRIKRILRESTRRYLDKIKEGYDIIIIAKEKMKEIESNEVIKEMEYLLNKANLIK